MCISMRPSTMANTTLYAGDAEWKQRYVHVLAYQNTAKSSCPNAMVLPLPATHLGPDNVVDTRSFPLFLADISLATHSISRTRGLVVPQPAAAAVFDVGTYTVVLAERPLDVADALHQVPANKRPALNDAVLASFDENYPGWPVAVCCWDGNVKAEPLLWWYEPRNPDVLFAPALDAHDGQPPRVGARVAVDHTLAFGSTVRDSYRQVRGDNVRYRDTGRPEIAKALLPDAVSGTRFSGDLANGDFIADVGDARTASRALPLGGVFTKYSTFTTNGWPDR